MPRALASVASRLAVASLCGLAFGFAAQPSSLPWLAWIALTPLLILLLRTPAPDKREALALGLAGGLGIGVVGFPWIAQTLQNFAGFPDWLALFGMVVHAAWMAVPYALFALGVALGPRQRLGYWLWPIALFATTVQLWPTIFPYTPAIGLITIPSWVQIAELGGVRMVESQVVLVSLLLARALGLETRSIASRARHGALAVALVLVCTLLGTVRILSIENETASARRVRIGVVQPNTPVLFRDPVESMRRLREASLRAEAQGAELVVWPEAGTYPFPLLRPLTEEPTAAAQRVTTDRVTPTLLGVVTFEPNDDWPYNSLVYMTPQGEVRGVFDKVQLVVFGERIPFVDPDWARRVIPEMGQLNAGKGPVRFDVELRGERRVAVGPLICYEDILPAFAHDVARQPGGIELFVNATIDAWYGGGSEPWEHLALAQLRSVEHRVPMVRSVSTGVTSVIDAAGRLVAAIPPRETPPGAGPAFESEVLVHDVAIARNTERAPTWFARVGWLYPHLCIWGTVITAAFSLWRSKRSAQRGVAERK